MCGSVRRVRLWLRDQGLKFPLQPTAYLRGGDITWSADLSCGAQHAHPPRLAGAYVFGRTLNDVASTRTGRWGEPPKRPQGEWEVLITDHHEGFIDWNTYQDNQSRSAPTLARRRTSPAPAPSARAARRCRGWPPAGVRAQLAVYYDGPAKTTPGYYCTGTGQLVKGRGTRHLRIGGAGIDTAVAAALLAALQTAALQALTYGVSRQTIMQRVKRGELKAYSAHRTQKRPASVSTHPARTVLTVTINGTAV